MTRTRFSILILAVLTALILAGCGSVDDSTVVSEEPGLQTFGVAVNPSAQPSTGQVMPGVSASVDAGNTASTGDNVTTDDQNVTVTPSTTAATTTTQSPSTDTSKPASSTAPSAEPSTSPSANIAPPAPVSSANVDEVRGYIGLTFQQLVEELGYPSSSAYEYIDQNDPDKGEIGTIYYPTFTVTTRRADGKEIVTDVVSKDSD